MTVNVIYKNIYSSKIVNGNNGDNSPLTVAEDEMTQELVKAFQSMSFPDKMEIMNAVLEKAKKSDFQEFQTACREYTAGMSSQKDFVCKHGTYDEVYAACLMAASKHLPYGLDEAERAAYKVLWTYHSIAPDTKATILHKVMECITKALVEDNGGYPLNIEGV